ncbi:MAG: protein kinase [Planctomycetales bacterium]|nr:protein kinase [Planctomycetales bacterium]
MSDTPTISSNAKKSDESHLADSDSFEQVLEQVIVALESDEPLDRETLAAQFPKYRAEVVQFIDNWLSMEHATAQLAFPMKAQPASAEHQLCGKIVGDYEILQVINRGGMGVVYRAMQKKLGRVVALKMVCDKHRDTVRFRLEAEAAAALHHANIVAIHEVNEFEGLPYISMQLVDGGTLHDRIQAGPLPLAESAQLVKTIADAVHYAHQRGILHRDLKPANVLLDQDSKPYVTDFGLAKQMGNSVEVTRSGAILGTPSYMSPEQAMGRVKSLSVAADIYALGAILYATLTGGPPFRAESDLLTLRKVIDDPPRPPRVVRPEIDRNLETICLKCLEKLPASRYSSARHLAEDLERYLRGEPVLARPVSATERQWRWCRRNPGLAALWGTVIVLVCSTLFFSIHLAWSEYKSRIASEQSAATESALREQANSARAEAESKRRAAIQTLGDLYESNGIWASQMELAGEALLWFSHASQLEGLDPNQVESNKIRCASWMTNSPMPVGAFQFTTPYSSANVRHHMRSFGFRPGQTELMCQADSGLVVWNYATDKRWTPSEQSLSATCGAWGPTGDLFAIGLADGEVRILDADTFETLNFISVPGSVRCLSFFDAQDLLAVATENEVHLFGVSDGKLSQSPLVHPAKIRQLVLSTTGKYLATVADDKKTRVFTLANMDNSDGTTARAIESTCFLEPEFEHIAEFTPCFSSDERVIYVRSASEKISAISTSTGEQVGKPLYTGHIQAVTADSTSQTWICCGESYARLWSVEKNRNGESIFSKHLPRLTHQHAITSADFGPHGIVATCSMDHVVKLWPVSPVSGSRLRWNDRETAYAVLPHQSQLALLRFSQDGKHLVTIQMDGLVRVWAIPRFIPLDYSMRMAQRYGIGQVADLEQWFVLGHSEAGYTVDMRRIRDGQIVANIPSNRFDGRGELLAAEFSVFQKQFATLHAPVTSSPISGTAESMHEIQIWSYPDGKPVGKPIELSSRPHELSFHPRSSELVIVDGEQAIYWFDTTSGKKGIVHEGLRPFQPVNGQLPMSDDKPAVSALADNYHIRHSQDGSFFVTWANAAYAKVWDSQSRRLRFEFQSAPHKRIKQLEISPDGKSIAIIHQGDSALWTLNTLSGSTEKIFDHPLTINFIQWNRDSKSLVTSCEDGKARVIDATTGDSLVPELNHSRSVAQGVFSPNGAVIATLCLDGCVRIWNAQDGLLLMPPMRVSDAIRQIEMGGDAAHLALIGERGQVEVLDLVPNLQYEDIDLTRVSTLAQLLSGKMLGSHGTVNLTSTQWLENWKNYDSSR